MSSQAEPPDFAQLATRFAALGHEARLRVLALLLRAHPQGLVVGEIQGELGIPSSTLTHHLDSLRHAGLIAQERQGRFLRYRARTEALEEALEFFRGPRAPRGAARGAPGSPPT
jgi:DNA-binding transcriptional ArsR family regulator